jgi:hypothetical protein
VVGPENVEIGPESPKPHPFNSGQRPNSHNSSSKTLLRSRRIPSSTMDEGTSILAFPSSKSFLFNQSLQKYKLSLQIQSRKPRIKYITSHLTTDQRDEIQTVIKQWHQKPKHLESPSSAPAPQALRSPPYSPITTSRTRSSISILLVPLPRH